MATNSESKSFQLGQRYSPLKGKVLWLTGASSGIGEAFAKAAAATGCKLAITARRGDVLQALAAECSKFGGQVLAVPGNVTDRYQMIGIVKQIENTFGPVDILVANAGTHVPTNVEQFDAREYDSIMLLNFSGVLYCVEAVLPQMLARKSGHLVGVSSVAGYRGLPRAAAYGASKAALTHFLESIRFDLLAYNVDVTVVSPGFVKTPLTDKNDFEMPFLIEAQKAAEILLRGVEKRKFEIHFPWQFTWIMKFLRVMPFPAYHKFILNRVLK